MPRKRRVAGTDERNSRLLVGSRHKGVGGHHPKQDEEDPTSTADRHGRGLF